MSNSNSPKTEAQMEAFLSEADKTAKPNSRISPAMVDAEIEKGTVEYPEVVLQNGRIFRWCVITLANGFSIVSDEPSIALTKERDNAEIGRLVVYKRAYAKLFTYLAFRTMEDQYRAAQ